METLSLEEFKKRYGDQGLQNLSVQQEPEKQGTFGEIKSRVGNAWQNIKSQYKGEGEYAGQGIIKRSTGMVGTAFDVPFGVAKDVLPEPAEKALEWTGEKVGQGIKQYADNWGQALSEDPAFQKFQAMLNKNPGLEKAIDEGLASTADVGGIAGNILMINDVASATTKAATKTANAVKSAVQPLAAPAGRVLKKAGIGSYGTTVTPEESTRIKMQNYQAKQGSLVDKTGQAVKGTEPPGAPITEAETAARHGLMGTEWRIGVQAKQAANKLWTESIQPKLQAIKGKVNMKDFFNQVEKEIRKSTKEISRRRDKLEALQMLREEYKNVGSISFEKLQEYKTGWAEMIPEATYKGKPIGSALKDVKNVAAEKVRELVYKYGGEGIKQDYIDYGNLQSIMKSGIKSIGDPAKKTLGRNIWEFVMDQVVTPVATVGGQVLYHTGEGLELIGKPGAKTVSDVVSKKLLRDLLLQTDETINNEEQSNE